MKLPKIGMGTFGSDRYDEEVVAAAVGKALELGYRLFDCASVYGNEKQIGEVFARAFAAGTVRREDIVVMSKVWNDMHGDGDVRRSCVGTLRDLGLDYLDVYFVHWPFPNFHAKGCDVTSRNESSRPFFVDEFVAVWRQMEALKGEGLVREIAVSNMTVAKFEAFLPHCEIRPFANEMELHPTFRQSELYEYCKAQGIEIVGYCPLGSPNRPERDRTPEDIADTQLKEIEEIAEAHGCHAAEICLAWAVRRGHTPIPFASKERNLAANLAAAENLSLTDEEMSRLESLDKNNRLVKGQVFLWKGSDDWHDLWDEDGTLAEWRFENNKWIKEKTK